MSNLLYTVNSGVTKLEDNMESWKEELLQQQTVLNLNSCAEVESFISVKTILFLPYKHKKS